MSGRLFAPCLRANRRASWHGLLLGTLGLAAGSNAVAAQSATLSPQIRSYAFSDGESAGVEGFRLITVPWSAAVGLGRRLSLSVDGAWADGRANGPEGRQTSLTGLTDTDFALRLALDDWIVVGADVTAPTGRSALSAEEALVAGVVAADLLPFPIQTWGSGGGAGGSVAIARQLGGWGLGLAAGYRRSGEFEPVPDAPVGYRPGDQLQLRVAADRDIGGVSTVSIVLGYQHFTDDRVLGDNLFQAGSRLQGLVSLAFPIGLRSSALVYGGMNHRARGTLLLEESQITGARDTPSQQLFLAGTDARMPLGRRIAVRPGLELRVFRAEDGASQGWVGEMPVTLDIRLVGNSASRRLVASPTGGVAVGNVIVERGANSRLFGWQAGLSIRVEGGR